MRTYTHTILCVDDDLDDLYFITTAVQRADGALHTATAYNGEEALAYLEEAKRTCRFPSLIIMDINMPRVNGKQALAQIKADPLLQDIPVVMYTTSNSPVDKLFVTTTGCPW